VPTASEKRDALESARKKLIYLINAFDYENQIQA
jgi:hypothetical protein